MIYKCYFNPDTDLYPTVENEFVDLNKAIETGTVESLSDNTAYNGITDPSEITGRCEDVFDAMDAMRALKARAASAAKSSENDKNA